MNAVGKINSTHVVNHDLSNNINQSPSMYDCPKLVPSKSGHCARTPVTTELSHCIVNCSKLAQIRSGFNSTEKNYVFDTVYGADVGPLQSTSPNTDH